MRRALTASTTLWWCILIVAIYDMVFVALGKKGIIPPEFGRFSIRPGYGAVFLGLVPFLLASILGGFTWRRGAFDFGVLLGLGVVVLVVAAVGLFVGSCFPVFTEPGYCT
jgi:hypothetical protein